LFHENTQTLYKFGCDKKTKAVSKAASRDCEGGTTKACHRQAICLQGNDKLFWITSPPVADRNDHF